MVLYLCEVKLGLKTTITVFGRVLLPLIRFFDGGNFSVPCLVSVMFMYLEHEGRRGGEGKDSSV